MLNKVILNGRLVKDVEVQGESAKSYCKFSLAVGRDFDKEKTDFFNCVAFGNTATFLQKYVKKGATLGVVGRLQQSSYKKKDGTLSNSVEVVVEQAYPLSKGEQGSNGSSNGSSKPTTSKGKTEYREAPYEQPEEDEFFAMSDDDLPF